ncbi:MAG: TrmH family RNA methyltransferase [Flavobacteriaceae bacterium]|nr:TrmH family RNA methyltransferase [Flavobacteriaceae bacterium]
MQKQLTHHETKLHKPKIKLVVNACLVHSPANLGSVFRIAEAFGVSYIQLLNQQEQTLSSNRFKRVSRNTESFINVQYVETIEECFLKEQKNEFVKIGIEITSNSKPINEFFPKQPVQFVLGNENTGIPTEILHHLNAVHHIPMYGVNSSLNVAQSLGICLYQTRNNESANL